MQKENKKNFKSGKREAKVWREKEEESRRKKKV